MEEEAPPPPPAAVSMRRRWPHLGAVETIYEELEHEEEIEEDSSNSNLSLSPSFSTSPSTFLQSTVKAWSMVKGLETDVAIHVQASCFHLHKDPLSSRSNYLKCLLTTSSEITLSPPLNITAETFDLVADYCYGGAIVITPVNVAALRIASELLEMSTIGNEVDSCENLRQKTETYFRRAVAVNREYASIVLRSCLSQMPEAETAAALVSKCIEALTLVDEGNDVLNYLQDIKTVECEDFRFVVESLYHKLNRTGGQDLLYRIIDLYFKEYIGSITDEQKMGICNYIDCSILSPQLLMHAVQNPRLPLRFVVQAMFIEQLNTRRTVISAANNHVTKKTHQTPDAVTLGALLQRDAALRQVAKLKSAMDATSSRIQSLEKELSGMRQVVLHNSQKKIKNDELDSGRSASFRLISSERMVEKGQRGSVSSSSYRSTVKARKYSSEELWGYDNNSSNSSMVRVEQKKLGRRLINGLKSAFGVGNLASSNKKNSQKSGGSKVDITVGFVGGDEYESGDVIVIKKDQPFHQQ